MNTVSTTEQMLSAVTRIQRTVFQVNQQKRVSTDQFGTLTLAENLFCIMTTVYVLQQITLLLRWVDPLCIH